MSAITANPDLLISALLREARKQPDPAAWLGDIQSDALTATLGGDLMQTSLGKGSAASAWIREIPANILAQLCESAIQRLEAEAAAVAAGITGDLPPGNVRFADFSSQPCTLG